MALLKFQFPKPRASAYQEGHMAFTFNLGQNVVVYPTREVGQVQSQVGRLNQSNQYQVAIKGHGGTTQLNTYDESKLRAEHF